MLIQDTVATQTVLFYYVKLAFDGCATAAASWRPLCLPSAFAPAFWCRFICVTGGACFLSGVSVGAAGCHPQRSQACYRPLFFLTPSGESNTTRDVVKAQWLFVPPPHPPTPLYFWNLQRYFNACCEWQDPGPLTRLGVLFLFWRLILAFNSGKHPSFLVNVRLQMPKALHNDEVTAFNTFFFYYL